jgi:leucyl aminopeptidase
MGPEEFEKTVKKAARGSGLKIKVLEEKDCKDMGMGCLTAVGAGSHRPSKMLILDWKGTQKAKGKTSVQALCGKGICFDTGGLNVKPDKSMLLMRKDMGGAATVAAAMIAIAKLNGEKAVRAYLPLAENALGPEAFRPGDILTACDGTTVEIGHTDAEGRLVLADAIALAVRDGAKSITSVATLTGAALVALGRIHVPVMGDKKEVQLLLDGAQQCGEKAWQLPLEDEHHQMVKGKFADLNNAGNGEAGCITAGAFLKHFAGDTPFAHCDISPASWKPSAHSLGAEGATGTWINTLISTFGNTWDVPSS